MQIEQKPSRIHLTVDLDAVGHHVGDMRFKWSDNINPLGFICVPMQSIKGTDGPIVLITGGVHGDEFEGPAAILRLCEKLSSDDLTGQVILIPALNHTALMASSRVTPQDGQNMNRAFPGDPDAGPTAIIAHFVESVLLAKIDAVIDLHSGGKASVFAPTALATRTSDVELFTQNMALAEVFGMPAIWILSAFSDSRSFNSAAARRGVTMIAAELGGGGGTQPDLVNDAEAGLLRCLAHLGVLKTASDVPGPARRIEVTDLHQTVSAPARGIFDRLVSASDVVEAGHILGWIRFVDEQERSALPIVAPCDGFVLAHSNRGLVERGELLIQLASEVFE